MNTTRDDVAARYIDAVRAELSDVPVDEVAEITEDVSDHLRQVSAELGEHFSAATLAERLGTPASYAAELRAAAGFEARPVGRSDESFSRRALRFLVTWTIRGAVAVMAVGAGISLLDGYLYAESAVVAVVMSAAALALWLLAHGPSPDPGEVIRRLPDAARVQAWYDRLMGRPWGPPSTEFIVSLRPAWWILRGWVAAQIVVLAFGGGLGFPIERSIGAVIVLAGAVAASIWWGRRGASHSVGGWPRLTQLAVNAILIIATPMMLVAAGQPGTDRAPYTEVYHQPVYDGFHHPDGNPIFNLFPYGPDGRLIENVRLFDQDGRPVDNIHQVDWDAECAGAEQVSPGNLFPRPQVELDPITGECVEVEIVTPFGAALPETPSLDGAGVVPGG